MRGIAPSLEDRVEESSKTNGGSNEPLLDDRKVGVVIPLPQRVVIVLDVVA